jgi:hypothetical protein
MIEPEVLFYYIYAVLWSPTYRQTYANGLKLNLPRIPFPIKLRGLQGKALVEKMSKLGRDLAMIHTLQSTQPDLSHFPLSIATTFIISKPTYNEAENRIYFTSSKKTVSSAWIDHISPALWNFEIGEIKQLKAWLDAHEYWDGTSEKNYSRHKIMSRPLTRVEMEEFQRLCATIELTLALIPQLDAIYLELTEHF